MIKEHSRTMADFSAFALMHFGVSFAPFKELEKLLVFNS